MARMFQHDPYDPHQKGSPHHRNIPIVLGESDSWGSLSKCPLKVGWVFYGKWWDSFGKPPRISWWAKADKTQAEPKQRKTRRLHAVAIPSTVEQGIEQETTFCHVSTAVVSVFLSRSSVYEAQWSAVSFIYHVPKNGTPKDGTTINIETENRLETNQWYSCWYNLVWPSHRTWGAQGSWEMVVASAKIMPGFATGKFSIIVFVGISTNGGTPPMDGL